MDPYTHIYIFAAAQLNRKMLKAEIFSHQCSKDMGVTRYTAVARCHLACVS